MRSTFAGAAVVIALVGFAPRANAAPITYELSAIASGKIGNTVFSDALVSLIGIGDTANIDSIFGGLAYATSLTSLTVTISGVGTATVTDPTEILSLPAALSDADDPDNELPPFPLVLFGRTDSPPDLSGLTGIGGVASDSLAGYNLQTSIGPIIDLGGVGFPPECGTPNHDSCLQTSLGALSFTNNDLVANGGTFTATLHPVPEPATALLVGSGLAALVGRSRRRKRG